MASSDESKKRTSKLQGARRGKKAGGGSPVVELGLGMGGGGRGQVGWALPGEGKLGTGHAQNRGAPGTS